jgi:hypothetical protein
MPVLMNSDVVEGQDVQKEVLFGEQLRHEEPHIVEQRIGEANGLQS